jgi:hypothetical protein
MYIDPVAILVLISEATNPEASKTTKKNNQQYSWYL